MTGTGRMFRAWLLQLAWAVVLVVILQTSVKGQSSEWEPWDFCRQSPAGQDPSVPETNQDRVVFPSIKVAALTSIRLYQNFVSPQTMPTCHFYPSCSHYSHQAIQRHGFIKGIIMSAERLSRCTAWTRFDHRYRLTESYLLSDPVERNSLW